MKQPTAAALLHRLKNEGVQVDVKLTVEDAYHEILHALGVDAYHKLLHLVKDKHHHRLLHSLGEENYHELLHVVEEEQFLLDYLKPWQKFQFKLKTSN